MLPIRAHDRYDYWPITEPAPFRWPEERGLAVYIALNLEQYSFGEGVLDELVESGGPPPDVINHAWLNYGNRVGAWRLLELMADCRLPLTCLVCAVSLHPHIAGQPHRLRRLRRAFEHIAAQRERIWATTAGPIADVARAGYGMD